MYRDFVDSAYGQALQYRKRRDRQFEIWWHGSLQTKGTRDSESNLSFQKSVRKMMEDMGRKGPYKGPIFLELQFHPPEKNAPSIQNLAKHYLDLLMGPLPGLSLNRKKLLLQDDSHIHFLSCSYAPMVFEEGIRLRVHRLSDFFADLKLYQALRSGDFGDRVKDKEDEDDLFEDDHVDSWLDFQRDRKEWKKRLGEEGFVSYELMMQRFAQEQALKQRKIPLRALRALFGTKHHGRRHHPMMKGVLLANASLSRFAYFHNLTAVDLGARPLIKGDSDHFKARVREGLEAYKKRIPLFSPLLVTVGVTIIYVPPVKAPKVDLDNLARRAIIPAVHEILEPPSSSIAVLRRLKVKHSDGDDIDEFIKRLKKMPPVQVAGYDILCAERLPDDPPNGSVKLLLHAGDAMRSTLTHLKDVLDQWERDVERD
jgi:Holliday junction resolvase RusA-like endonuclease